VDDVIETVLQVQKFLLAKGVREMIQGKLAGVVPCDIRNLGVE
jgi:hypothetical protein